MRAPPLLAQPLGISSWGGALRRALLSPGGTLVMHAPPFPPPPSLGQTALGPVAVGISERGSPLPSVDTLGWSLPAVWLG